MATINLNKGFKWGHLDALHLLDTGLVRLVGWTRDASYVPDAILRLANIPRECVNVYRVYRPDVAGHLKSDESFHGIVCEFSALPAAWKGPCTVTLEVDRAKVISAPVDYSPSSPHYDAFYGAAPILHREQVYGSGPPSTTMSPEAAASLSRVRGPALDFGCGIGLVVKQLRAKGIDACGLELNRPAIAQGLPPELREFIKLYDGAFPIPYADNQFNCVTCFEVLEHIENYEAALNEIARVSRSQFIMSVPDMSAIPDCFPHRVIPWHLLESTHVNFFCQKSLEALLRKHFKRIEMARIGRVPVNDTFCYTSLLAICSKD